MNKDINKLRIFFKLKEVYRRGKVKERQESVAEHSWTALVIADYLVSLAGGKIDRLKVYELVLYHDIGEIEVGDTPYLDVKDRKKKEEDELSAVRKLENEFPKSMGAKITCCFEEFVERRTKEAKIAFIADRFEAIFHYLDYKSEWKGWTEEIIRKMYLDNVLEEFPEINAFFEEIIDFLNKEGYLGQ